MPNARMALVPKDTDSTGSTPRADTGIMPQVHRRDQEGDGSGTGVEPRKCGFGRRASDTQPRRAAAVDLFESEGTGRAATTDQGLERRKCGVTWQLAYHLSRVVEGKRAEIRQLQHDLRHEKIVVDVAGNAAAQLGQRWGSSNPRSVSRAIFSAHSLAEGPQGRLSGSQAERGADDAAAEQGTGGKLGCWA